MEGRTTLLLARSTTTGSARVERLPLSNPGRDARAALAAAVGIDHHWAFHAAEHEDEAVETTLASVTSGDLDAERMTFNGEPVDGPTLAMLATARARVRRLQGMGYELRAYLEVRW